MRTEQKWSQRFIGLLKACAKSSGFSKRFLTAEAGTPSLLGQLWRGHYREDDVFGRVAEVIAAILAEAVKEIAVSFSLITQRLAVEWIGHGGGWVIGREFGQRCGIAILMRGPKLLQSDGGRAQTEVGKAAGFPAGATLEAKHKHADEQQVAASRVVGALPHESIGFYPFWKRGFSGGHELLKCLFVELLLLFDVAHFLKCGDPSVAFIGARVDLGTGRGQFLEKFLRVRENNRGVDSLARQGAADWLAASVRFGDLVKALRQLV